MAGIAQVISSDSASGAQVIDGSLRFDSSSEQHLKFTPANNGNKRTFTWSGWVKFSDVSTYDGGCLLCASSGSLQYTQFKYFCVDSGIPSRSFKLNFQNYSGSTLNNEFFNVYTTQVFRDPTAWTHIVLVVDTTIGTSTEQVKIYINGTLAENTDEAGTGSATFGGGTTPGASNYNVETHFSRTTDEVQICGHPSYANDTFDGQLSHVYFIDGGNIAPERFAYTDPLTNTWRPKKFKINNHNNNETWSDSLSATGGFASGHEAVKGFDGKIVEDAGTQGSNYAMTSSAAQNQKITFGPSTPIEYNHSVEVHTYNASGVKIEHNGNSVPCSAGNFVTVSTGSGTISNTNPVVVDTKTTSNYAQFVGIRVDGILLRDNIYNNSFYLPMDGNSPIGEDKSGLDHDFKPYNLNGTLSLDNPIVSGAKPILNTTQGGTQAGVGVFGSKENRYYTLTASSNTSSGFVFENEGTRPYLYMIRGATYTFDYSAASSHPFRFVDTSLVQYTTGTSITGNIISFTVPHDAPDLLYYICANHAGMGNGISITTDETKTDKYASNCVLAMPLLSNVGDVSHLINVNSTEKVVTNNGSSVASSNSNFYIGSWNFDYSDDYLSIPDDSDFTFGSNEFTMECWFFQTGQASWNYLMGQYGSSNTTFFAINSTRVYCYFYYSGTSFILYDYHGSGIDPNVWHHVAVTRDSSNKFRLFIDGVVVDSSTQSITLNDSSVAFTIGADSNSDYHFQGQIQDVRVYKGVAKYSSGNLNEQAFIPPSKSPDILPDSPSGVSVNPKLTKITDGAVSFDGTGDYLTLAQSNDFDLTGDYTIEAFIYYTNTSNNPTIFDFSAVGGNYEGRVQIQSGVLHIYDGGWSSRGAISSNTWHHVAVTQSRVYVDGIDVGASSGSVSGSNYKVVTIGARTNDGGSSYGDYFTGFISNVRIVNGTALYTANFTPPTRELTNVTNTKLLCCQSNTSATEGTVKPGTITANGNATATTFNPFNTDINTVRGQETGYATLNPLNNITEATFADGNLKVTTKNAPIHWGTHTSTLSMSSGKYYAEVTVESTSGYPAFGVCDVQSTFTDISWIGSLNPAISYYGNFGVKYVNGASAATYGSNFGAGNTIGIAVDLDNLTVEFFKDGTSQGLITGLTGNTEYVFGGSEYDTGSGVFLWNYGQKPFKFPPPDGFQPLTLANVRPETVITRPDKFVSATIWDGNDVDGREIDVGMSPDMIIVKARDYGSNWYWLSDTVRGTPNKLYPNSNTNEDTAPVYGQADSFTSKGWIAGGGTHSTYPLNDNNSSLYDYVCWSWKAGGSAGTWNKDGVAFASAADVGLTGITSPATLVGASIGTKQGFSIIRWNRGADSPSWSTGVIPHGLTQAPDFIITKNLGVNKGWMVFHQGKGTGRLYWNNNLTGDGSGYTTLPTDTHFTIDNTTDADSSNDCMSYCWHNVPGLQKFGKYTGNNSSDGHFIELGFRPAIIIFKNITTSGNNGHWVVLDNKRDPSNGTNNLLYLASTTFTENTYTSNLPHGDFLSNGFKLRGSYVSNSDTFVYAAWAETPSSNLFGGQSNAR